MTTLIVLGAGLGLGMPALATRLRELTVAAAPPADDVRGAPRGLRATVAFLRAVGLPAPATARDLALLERPIHDYLTEKVALALGGLLTPAIVAVALQLLGADLGIQLPAAAAIVGATTGFLLPDHRTRRHAARRRNDFRHALSAFLDLVVISLAGGAGVDSALAGAANVGHGWAFARIQRALADARLTRTTPWNTLQTLGRDLDIAELTELAASVSLAGTEGAKVRQSLHAKASALRTRQLTDAEGNAAADTERMSLPVMALFLGFLAFITYPAIGQVLNGL
jgi:tight adherence protein C